MSHSCCLLDIVGCTCSGLSIYDLLCAVSAHTNLDSIHQITLLDSKLIFFRETHCKTKGLSMWNDSDLMKWIYMLQVVVEKSMACLVVCSGSLFIFCHKDTLLSDPKQYLVSCFFEVLHINNGLIASCCEKCSFVNKVS